MLRVATGAMVCSRRTIRFCPETRSKAPRRVKASKRTSDSVVGTMLIAGATLANVVGCRAVGDAAFSGEGLLDTKDRMQEG